MKKLISGAVFYLLLSISSYAQNGTISGRVIDELTGEELLGATVLIKGTSQGSATDFNGNYVIKNLQAGKYTVVFSYISYGTKEITDVIVTAGKATTVDVALKEAVLELTTEMVVTASYKQETANALLIAQKNAFSIGNGVSGDVIRKSAASNSGDVIKQVSGATVQGGKFAVIRGLNDRYNAAMINGSPLPSTEPERRAFSFDLFPSNMLDQL
ncbi:MAG TPA: carboxypeptidase-like regulatory domain-containing protein, partial [Bacteroidia bacterium]|nr:carboxypeptidase-like regulatory domain-containing protein [Bacteroidia bacterium]